ncbi:hypothetical protein ACFX2A_042410 [Malus domestica]
MVNLSKKSSGLNPHALNDNIDINGIKMDEHVNHDKGHIRRYALKVMAAASGFNLQSIMFCTENDTPSGTTIHLTTPNGIVNVNSLFSLAVFIALTWNPSDPSNRLIEDDATACLPGPPVAKDLVINTMNLMKK